MKKSLLSISLLISLSSLSAFAAGPEASQPATPVSCRPRLVVHKSGPREVESGREGRYFIEVLNVSRECDALDVDVTDRLSAHTIFVSASTGGVFGGPDLGIYGGLVKWHNVRIDAGDRRVFEVRVRFVTDRPHIAIDTGCALSDDSLVPRAVPACESAETQIIPDRDADWDRSLPVSRG